MGKNRVAIKKKQYNKKNNDTRIYTSKRVRMYEKIKHKSTIKQAYTNTYTKIKIPKKK